VGVAVGTIVVLIWDNLGANNDLDMLLSVDFEAGEQKIWLGQKREVIGEVGKEVTKFNAQITIWENNS